MFSQLRYVQEQLDRLTFSQLRELADDTDVPFGTIRRIRSRETANPRVQAIDKLATHFRTREKRRAA